jgi:hypothetical protein
LLGEIGEPFSNITTLGITTPGLELPFQAIRCPTISCLDHMQLEGSKYGTQLANCVGKGLLIEYLHIDDYVLDTVLVIIVLAQVAADLVAGVGLFSRIPSTGEFSLSGVTMLLVLVAHIR